MEERQAERRRQRRTPLTPSQKARRRVAGPKRAPGDRYNTRSYYYRSVRIGRRVTKRYYGRGAIATQAEWLDAEARRRRDDEREALRADRSRLEPVEELMKDLDVSCRRMFEAMLLAAGYHHSQRT
jgi:hypothetical protein